MQPGRGWLWLPRLGTCEQQASDPPEPLQHEPLEDPGMNLLCEVFDGAALSPPGPEWGFHFADQVYHTEAGLRFYGNGFRGTPELSSRVRPSPRLALSPTSSLPRPLPQFGELPPTAACGESVQR